MRSRSPSSPTPFDGASLEFAALRYVERFQTTEARLVRHLRQKLRARGWAGEGEPDPEGIAARLVRLGYIDDAAFAEARARGLGRRGLGVNRLRQSLAAYGVDAEIVDAASSNINPLEAALVFARRRRLGPFGPEITDPKQRERQFAAMLRAGHGPRAARAILSAGTPEDAEALVEN